MVKNKYLSKAGVMIHEYLARTSLISAIDTNHIRICTLSISIYPISFIQAHACTREP
ncbi:hypothetical protein [Thermoactinomyces sp. DSM 45892]|uniref:hypothetical protein n=1 Tax=Thermoactinomyces sp. DSM 45892 TaxID=1882753 RepID=UPI00089A6B7D|nr:hypothetical protein [Thermoactinomyces sp. DSM 45892]SDY26712.1 hypothetical protein SAMN05444416_103134 [Thermoactinomyces sp. DSM 45892]